MRWKSQQAGVALGGMTLGALLLLAPDARAQVLVQYNVQSSAGAAASVAPTPGPYPTSLLATFSPLARNSPPLTAVSATGAYNSAGYTTGGTATTALTNGEYISFSVTPNAFTALVLSSLTFTDERGVGGPTSIFVRSSLDNYATDLPLNNSSVPQQGTTNRVVNLSGAQFQAVRDTTLTFRIYGFGADNSNPSAAQNAYRLSTNPVVLNGVVAVVPEPGTAALVGVGLSSVVGMVSVRRRRRWAV